MQKLAKRTAALVCAMLMTVGAFSQASAGAISVESKGAKMTGTARKVNTTTASATTIFYKGASGAFYAKAYVRAYIKVNGTNQYGSQEDGPLENTTATATNQVYVMAGSGTTGYGGDHSAAFIVSDGTGDTAYGMSKESVY